MAENARPQETQNPEAEVSVKLLDYADPALGGQRIYDPDRISDDGYIYTPYITVNGRVIFHPKGGVFRFRPKNKS